MWQSTSHWRFFFIFIKPLLKCIFTYLHARPLICFLFAARPFRENIPIFSQDPKNELNGISRTAGSQTGRGIRSTCRVWAHKVISMTSLKIAIGTSRSKSWVEFVWHHYPVIDPMMRMRAAVHEWARKQIRTTLSQLFEHVLLRWKCSEHSCAPWEGWQSPNAGRCN